MAVDGAKVAELRSQLNVANKALDAARQAYVSSPEFQEAMKEQCERRTAIERAAAGIPAVEEFRKQVVVLQKSREEAVAKFVADNPQLNLVAPVAPQALVEGMPAVAAALVARDGLAVQLEAVLKG